MIQPGLERISKLVQRLPMPWRAVHVAGTNGKGSVCSYVSTMLTAGKVRCGRFTSPHLIDRWDCIAIDNQAVDEHLFHRAEGVVKSRNYRDGIKASEFELLTATAFEIFTAEKIQVAVVETGMGGRYDATNVLAKPLATVITKIAMDHESFLGGSLDAIAHHKAGIMKNGTPCVIDGSNAAGVVDVLKSNAATVGASPLITVPPDARSTADAPLREAFEKLDLASHQQTNLALAYEATKYAMEGIDRPMDPRLLSALSENSWPGRLQIVNIPFLRGRTSPILLDGAHNLSSIDILASHVDRKLRVSDQAITWILGFSQGKDVRGLMPRLIKPQDKLIATSFGPVDGMPWVEATPPTTILEAAERVGKLSQAVEHEGPIHEVLQIGARIAAGDPIVVAGSLYLVSDVLRAIRPHNASNK